MYLGSPSDRVFYTNEVIDSVVTDLGNVEVVSVTDVKRELRLQFDTSGSYNFNDDDSLLATLILRAIDIVEAYTGVAVARRTYRAVLRNGLNNVELPWYPLGAISSITDVDGNTLTADTDYKVYGTAINTTYDYLTVIYTAGYLSGECPPALKAAILQQIVWMYNHAGDEAEYQMCKAARITASSYKRKSVLQ